MCVSEKISWSAMSFWNSDANHSIEEIIAEIGKTKNISVEMTHGGEICGHPNLRWSMEEKDILFFTLKC